MSRIENAKRNGIWSGIHKLIAVVFPFFVKKIIVAYLGSSYLGLNAFFVSIIGFLNIFDLGIGGAIVYSLYKPIAENDDTKVRSLLKVFRKINLLIGLAIFVIGIVVMPLLNYLIKDGVPPSINLYVLYVIYLINACCSYLVFGYQINLLFALQRNDIISKIDAFSTLLLYTFEIFVIIKTKNFYLYELLVLGHTLVKGCIANLYVKKEFPHYFPVGDIDKETKNSIKSKTAGLFVSKIAALSKNSFDSVVVSTFQGLETLAIFNNYYLIVNSVMMISNVFVSSIVSIVGNSIVIESKEKNLKDFYRLNFLSMIIFVVCTSLMLNLYQPFIRLWVGEKLLFSTNTMLIFPLYYFFLAITQVQNAYIDAGGLWDKKKKYAVIETITNIILNIILGYFVGVVGIVLSTIITMIIFDLFLYAGILFRELFQKTSFKYTCSQLLFVFLGYSISLLSFLILSSFDFQNIIFELIIKSLSSIVLTFILLLITYSKTKILKESFDWAKIILGVSIER